MTDKKGGYLGNANLKPAGVGIEFTKDQVEEYMKCAQDPIYFIKKYVKVVSLDEGLVPFNLYDYQEEIVNDNDLVYPSLCTLQSEHDSCGSCE